MKVKTLACLCALAAIPAFGTGTIAVESANTFGVLKVNCSAKKVIIATPWVECLTAGSIKVTNLVMTANLTAGDAIIVYAGGAFKGWQLTAGKAWEPYAVADAGGTVTVGDASSEAIARGLAFWFIKSDYTSGSYDLYLYGQDTSASATSSIAQGSSGTPAYSLVASPKTTDANLNATGVVGFTPNAADEIHVPPTGGKLLDTVYNYKSGSGWGTDVIVSVGGRNKKQWQAGCTIPAGTGFWYVSKGGTGTISWQ